MLYELRPMLQTEDYEGTLDFYINTLGFTCEGKMPQLGWAALIRDRVAIMISRPNSHTPFTGPKLTGSIYVTVDNVEELWQAWKDKVKVCYPIETFEYDMREFGIYDNNGYLLNFGQDAQSLK